MKNILLIITAVLIVSCGKKSSTNISTGDALSRYGQELSNRIYYAFPGTRDNPLKWYDSLPEINLKKVVRPGYFMLKARPDELFVWQIGVWALKKDIKDISLEFSGFKARGHVIPPDRFTCYNLSGNDFRGRPFTKKVDVQGTRVQSLWIGVDLEGIRPGNYRGAVTVTGSGEQQTIPVLLRIAGQPVINHGYDEGAHLSRLNWLNSTEGIDENITKGYLPVSRDGNLISILGRKVAIADNGLPSSITSFFGPSNQSLEDKGEQVISRPFRFIVERKDGSVVRLVPGQVEYHSGTPGKVEWTVNNTSDEFELAVSGRLEFDGFIGYSLKLSAKKTAGVRDIRLEIPVTLDKSRYIMGLGHEGGIREGDWKWKWDTTKNQDMVWLGAVNGGLRLKLKDENYVRPLINVYYKYGPLRLPSSWGNGGLGGIDITGREGEVIIDAYSGERELRGGEVLNYDFELLVTPFRVIDRHIKFGDRYYHGGGTVATVKVDSALRAGANILNIHHAEDIYPFINYPYLDANTAAIRRLADSCHKAGIRLKLYYTTREFTKNLPEFWAFNSLNGEIVYPGPGDSCRTVINPSGPKEWYIRNLREKYIPAWYNEIREGKFTGETDLSVISTPDSRLNNFYIAGLGWMVRNLEIDGVYIDDSALDRYTLMRARKIIDRDRPEGRMDLHSWNHFNEFAGYTSCLNLYMDLLPYFDLIWIGEGRNYNRSPDHWLIEVSGIPFGLPGQMLEGGGNPWRGMVYGITNRAGYLGLSPSSTWKFWDEYKIEKKIMTGYWEKNCPVRPVNPAIQASVYAGEGEVLVALANWTDTLQTTALGISWQALGLDPAQTEIFIPHIEGFQTEQLQVPLENIGVPGKKGYVIVLKKKN